MNKTRLFSALAFLMVLAFSCNRKSATITTIEKPEVKEEVVATEILDREDDPKVEVNTEDEDGEEPVYILCELKRTACYGQCPVYTVKLYSDGRASYQGMANVDKLGDYTAFCAPQDFESLFEAAEEANYFVLRSQYPEDGRKLTDLPKTISYLKRDGLEKRIIDNFDAPTSLVQFENWLDAFFDGLDWSRPEDNKR